MPETARISADAIAALLGGLADALTDAQQSMAELPPSDAFGRPLPGYRIPELDFNFEIETVQVGGQKERAWWQLQPARTASPRTTISSTISGKIVAVPPNGGLPETQIVAVQHGDSLEVRVSNSAGEVLTETPVELEFDAQASSALYGTTLAPDGRLALLDVQLAYTSETGVANIKLGPGALQSDQSAVVLVRAAGAETRVSVRQGG